MCTYELALDVGPHLGQLVNLNDENILYYHISFPNFDKSHKIRSLRHPGKVGRIIFLAWIIFPAKLVELKKMELGRVTPNLKLQHQFI